MKIFNIGEAARILEVPFYTIQYLERTGKIPKASRSSSGHRYYTNEDLEILKRLFSQKQENQNSEPMLKKNVE